MDTMMILGKKFINYKEFFHTHTRTHKRTILFANKQTFLIHDAEKDCSKL